MNTNLLKSLSVTLSVFITSSCQDHYQNKLSIGEKVEDEDDKNIKKTVGLDKEKWAEKRIIIKNDVERLMANFLNKREEWEMKEKNKLEEDEDMDFDFGVQRFGGREYINILINILASVNSNSFNGTNAAFNEIQYRIEYNFDFIMCFLHDVFVTGNVDNYESLFSEIECYGTVIAKEFADLFEMKYQENIKKSIAYGYEDFLFETFRKIKNICNKIGIKNDPLDSLNDKHKQQIIDLIFNFYCQVCCRILEICKIYEQSFLV